MKGRTGANETAEGQAHKLCNEWLAYFMDGVSDVGLSNPIDERKRASLGKATRMPRWRCRSSKRTIGAYTQELVCED